MPTSIQNLREHKNELARQANEILAKAGDKAWSKEDGDKYDGLTDEIERLNKQIAAHQKQLDDRALETAPKRDKDTEKEQQRTGVDLYLRKLTRELSAEEAIIVRNTMSTTTGSQGGYTVPALISPDMVNTMKDYGGMRRVADRLLTGNGQQISYPTSDGTSEMGEIVAQNGSAASADPTFGTVAIGAFKFSSKVIAVPIELLQDSEVDIIAFINQRMRDRIGRIQNLKFTQGAGTTEPNGLVTAATVGKTGTTGQTATIIYDDLVDMADSVDVAYLSEGMLSWQFGQTLRKVIRKIKDSQGRPIWTPGYDEGITQNVPDTLLGYPVNINNDMPAPAANAKSLSFGQHKKYLIRDSMEVTLFKFEDSVYISKGQVGFLAWMRSDGNLIDVNGVRLYQHSAT